MDKVHMSKPSADTNLESLGYTAEIRNITKPINMASDIHVLHPGLRPHSPSTTMNYSITGSSSVSMVWSWILVSLITLCVCSSLAEITSVFPTAGGVYYQTFTLSPP
jgi:hypothetical protein